MEAIEIIISLLILGVTGLGGRLWHVSEKRRDERHNEMVDSNKEQNKHLNSIIQEIQKEIKSLRDEMSMEFDKRDRQISDNRHQMKNIQAQLILFFTKENPKMAEFFEKFYKTND